MPPGGILTHGSPEIESNTAIDQPLDKAHGNKCLTYPLRA